MGLTTAQEYLVCHWTDRQQMLMTAFVAWLVTCSCEWQKEGTTVALNRIDKEEKSKRL